MMRGMRGFGARDHVERGGRAAFHDREQRAAHAVQAHGILLRIVAVVNLRHVAEADRRAVDDLDRQIVQVVNRADAAVHADVVFGRADFGGAAGQDQILRVDGVDDVLRREIFGLERRAD